MKRSQMLKIIKECIEESKFNPDYWNNLEEQILLAVEKAGMLPPVRYKKHVGNTYSWELEYACAIEPGKTKIVDNMEITNNSNEILYVGPDDEAI